VYIVYPVPAIAYTSVSAGSDRHVNHTEYRLIQMIRMRISKKDEYSNTVQYPCEFLRSINFIHLYVLRSKASTPNDSIPYSAMVSFSDMNIVYPYAAEESTSTPVETIIQPHAQLQSTTAVIATTITSPRSTARRDASPDSITSSTSDSSTSSKDSKGTTASQAKSAMRKRWSSLRRATLAGAYAIYPFLEHGSDSTTEFFSRSI